MPTGKNQSNILEKGKYVAPDQIFKAFVGIVNNITMNDNEYLQLIERSKT